MDSATHNLDRIKNSGEYVCLPGVVCFDEHDEHDAKGKLLRRFGRAELQEIADQCNLRETTTGDLAPGGPGHTKDKVKTEEDQPPVWLYARNYRVGTFGPSNKVGLLCDYYVKKQIRTSDGHLVDGVDYVKSFPRRSVELWPDTMTIDWHALLRRSPQRDLGLLTYSRDSHSTLSYSPRRTCVGSVNRNGKLRYSMEPDMADDINPVADPAVDVNANFDDGDEAPPEGHEDFAKHLDYACKNHPALKYMCGEHKKYEAGAMAGGADGAPGADVPPPAMPAAPPADEPMRNQRGNNKGTPVGDVQVSKYQREIQEIRNELAAAKQEKRILRYEKTLTELQGEGFDLDLQAELDECSGMDEKNFEGRVKQIRRSYSRTPVGGDLPLEAISVPAGEADLNDEKVAQKVFRYMRDNDMATKYGERAFRESAKALGLIK